MAAVCVKCRAKISTWTVNHRKWLTLPYAGGYLVYLAWLAILASLVIWSFAALETDRTTAVVQGSFCVAVYAFRHIWPPIHTKAMRSVCQRFILGSSTALAVWPPRPPRLGCQPRAPALMSRRFPYGVSLLLAHASALRAPGQRL